MERVPVSVPTSATWVALSQSKQSAGEMLIRSVLLSSDLHIQHSPSIEAAVPGTFASAHTHDRHGEGW